VSAGGVDHLEGGADADDHDPASRLVGEAAELEVVYYTFYTCYESIILAYLCLSAVRIARLLATSTS
jgi:hypothetical protein